MASPFQSPIAQQFSFPSWKTKFYNNQTIEFKKHVLLHNARYSLYQWQRHRAGGGGCEGGGVVSIFISHSHIMQTFDPSAPLLTDVNSLFSCVQSQSIKLRSLPSALITLIQVHCTVIKNYPGSTWETYLSKYEPTQCMLHDLNRTHPPTQLMLTEFSNYATYQHQLFWTELFYITL